MSFLGGRGKPKGSATPSVTPASSGGRRSGSSAIESTIGPNTYVKGDIQGDGGLRIDGKVVGTINLTGNLVVTESAKINAEIKANSILVAGNVEGNITADRLEISDTGRVWGNLIIKELVVRPGGYFQGKSDMPNDIQPPQLEPPKLSSPAALPAVGPGTVVDVEAKSPNKKK